MKLTVAFQNSDVVLAVEVSSEMSVEDFMAYALDEAGFPLTSSTSLQWQDQTLDRGQTLEQCGVNEEDMVIISSGAPAQNSSNQRRPLASSRTGGAGGAGTGQQTRISAAQVEQMRQEILYNPQMFTEFSEKMPELAASVHDPQEFAQAFAERQIMMQDAWNNPMSSNLPPEKLQEMLAQRELDENLTKAMEEMPESFVPVTMLYIELEINGHPVKAFVDSGAQATILSPECAKRCELEHLVDKRYKGTAYGVGTSEIIGRVHMAPIKIGSGYFPCGFTVLKGIQMDMLFGLDMLRHHQAVIDLKQNALILGDQMVPFLGEADLPESAKIKVSEQAAKTAAASGPGAVAGPSAQAVSRTSSSTSSNVFNRQPSNAGPSLSQTQGPGYSLNSRPQGYQQQAPPHHEPQHVPQTQPQQPQPQQQQQQQYNPPAGAPPSNRQYDEEAINNLISFGFPREKVLNALQRADGSAEIAASILFDES